MNDRRRLSRFAESQLEPYAEIYAAANRALIGRLLRTPDLDRLAAAAAEPTETNCGYLTFEAAHQIRGSLIYARLYRESLQELADNLAWLAEGVRDA